MGYGAKTLGFQLAFASLVWAASVWGAAAAPTVTVAALGDSLTAGYGLPPEDGFVPQLQAWLDAHGAAAKVVNAGVSGDTTAGGLARIDWTLTPDVGALIVALGGNDVLRGLPPEEARANLKGILDKARERNLPVLLIGIGAPGNYGPDYKLAFDAIYPDLARDYDALLVPDFLGAVRAAVEAGTPAADLFQPDNIHPSKAGVAATVAAIGPAVAELVRRAGG